MKTPTALIVNTILLRGNAPGLITEWFDGMRAWAENNQGPDASALRTWLGIVKARPFYTADELSKLWPALQLTLGLAPRMIEPPSANRLANELSFHRLPMVVGGEFNDKHLFRVPERPSSLRRYFIVEHVHKWRDRVLSQEEFENAYFHNG